MVTTQEGGRYHAPRHAQCDRHAPAYGGRAGRGSVAVARRVLSRRGRRWARCGLEVAVVGGGNSALQGASDLSRHDPRVSLISLGHMDRHRPPMGPFRKRSRP